MPWFSQQAHPRSSALLPAPCPTPRLAQLEHRNIDPPCVQVFEELLPYDKFTVRVPEREIPRLHEILEAIQQQPGLVQAMQVSGIGFFAVRFILSPANFEQWDSWGELTRQRKKVAEESWWKLGAMQAELACVHQFFLWSSMVGTYGKENGQTDAFGALMEILRRRVDGEVGQWDTACGKTLDTLSDRVAPPIPCHKGGCHGSARMQVTPSHLMLPSLEMCGCV